MAGAGLRLEVRDYDGPAKWRWVLTGADGEVIAEHEVRLDEAAWQFEAFVDMHHYLSWHVAPDRRGIVNASIVAEVGTWITEQVLGTIADELARRARRRHVTVVVSAPPEAADLHVPVRVGRHHARGTRPAFHQCLHPWRRHRPRRQAPRGQRRGRRPLDCWR